MMNRRETTMRIKAVLQFDEKKEAWELAFTDPSVKVYFPPIEQQVNSQASFFSSNCSTALILIVVSLLFIIV